MPDSNFDNLYHATVVDNTGSKIGGVSQIYLDDQTQQPRWVTVNTGFFGTKETFVPLDQATITGDEIRVPYDKDFVKNAPSVDPDGHIDEAQEDELYRYYAQGAGYASTGVEHDVATSQHVDTTTANVGHTQHTGADEGDVVLREERLNVGKQRTESGRVRLTKHVVTENQTVNVPVQREELRVERVPLNDADVAAAGTIGDNLGEGEVQEIVLHEERPVVSKETVGVEKVRLGTQTVTENVTVNEQVAKERVDIDTEGSVGTTGTGTTTTGSDDRSLLDKAKDKLDRNN